VWPPSLSALVFILIAFLLAWRRCELMDLA
jgi:hypothetical protein